MVRVTQEQKIERENEENALVFFPTSTIGYARATLSARHPRDLDEVDYADPPSPEW